MHGWLCALMLLGLIDQMMGHACWSYTKSEHFACRY